MSKGCCVVSVMLFKFVARPTYVSDEDFVETVPW